METRVIEIDPQNIDMALLRQAAEVINNRGLVAFPTETVYGLGADALDSKAVSGIFQAKKRPLDDPLIVHISTMKELEDLASDVPDIVYKLADRFWPGPLTMVLKKSDRVPDIVTTGLDTVAIRMPSHPIASRFIDMCACPLAAPSANLFSKPSPTTAMHVLQDLEGNVDMILDGGATYIGVESTVIDVSSGPVKVLRPGGVSVEELTSLVGPVEVLSEGAVMERTPGKYPRHYSPNAKVLVVEYGYDQFEKATQAAETLASRGASVGIMASKEHEDLYQGNVKVLGPANDGRICASRLFSILREFDSEKVNYIIAEGIPEKGLGRAVMNRIRKAAGSEEKAEEDMSDMAI
ncbi:MAG: L-threonylcarbamoyladenylate synthase [Candidatus Omnitrophica bacterium]|nr:L-threonylcarbamoyladenylate synthase [Candidatus Omnitrophota bacterium]